MRVSCLSLCLLAAALEARPEDVKPRTPVYTNADLERVSPGRGDTGVLSTPAESPAPRAAARSAKEDAAGADGERYWRREAERLRDRLETLEERAGELRLRIEERRRKAGVRPLSDAQIQAWQARLAGLETRIHGLQSRFEERARRAGALPGWLR